MSLKRSATAYGAYSTRGVPVASAFKRMKSTKQSLVRKGSIAASNKSLVGMGSVKFSLNKGTRVYGVSPYLKAAVNRVIEQRAEKKETILELNAGAVYTTGATSTVVAPTFFGLIPAISQGTNDGQRSSNEIRVSKMLLRFQLNRTQAAESRPMHVVRVVLCKIKGSPANSPTLGNWAEIVKASGTTYTALTSTDPFTNLLPYNNEVWDIKWQKEYKVGKVQGNQTTTGNNDSVACVLEEVDITKFVKQKLLYDGTTTLATNDQLYAFVFVMPIDGTAVTVGDTSFYGVVHMQYTDL